MIKRMRILSVFLAVLLLLVMAPLALAADEGYATRGQIVEMLLTAADDYTPGLEKSDIVKGYGDGDAREDQYVRRAEAFVMVSRAFGRLEAPTGHNARITLTDLSFTDVPAWAEADVRNLVQGGVLTGAADGSLAPNAYVTVEQMELIIKRIFMLKATNLKDDFYAAYNRDILAKTQLRPGYSMDGVVMQPLDNVDAALNAIIKEIISTPQKAGSVEQKIANYYNNIVDLEARNAACLSPLRSYLDEAAAVKSLDDVLALRSRLLKETGSAMLIGFAPAADLTDSSVYSMVFATLPPTLTKADYAQADGAAMQALHTYISALFAHSGMSEAEAAAAADTVLRVEKELAAAMLDAQDYANAEKLNNRYTMAELQALFPEVDLSAMLLADGYQADENFTVYDAGLMRAFAPLMTEARLDDLRIYLQYGLLNSFGGALCEEMMEIANAFNETYLGVEPVTDINVIAMAAVQNTMSEYLGEIYAKEHFSAAAKKDVADMVANFIEIYEARIRALDWMSDETKEMALRKLGTMTAQIGYPDTWSDYLEDIDIRSAAEGGSYFDNVLAITRYNHAETRKLQNTKVQRGGWMVPVYTVDAFYNAQTNTICLPAGILQKPFYDVEASREENLGGIGFIIAHEITHSFDNNGAQFDEYGNAANWWTEADYAKFNELCLEVAAYFDGVECAPGIANNGVLTLSENIADLGAAYCITEAASQLQSPDYQKLYGNLAYCWAASATREMIYYTSVADVHSWRNIRVNRNLQSIPEFYAAYDIQPGDGMYLAPEERVRIW